MGLDNGVCVRSNKRNITRNDLPSGIIYPFSQSISDTEIVYWRKNWGLRNDVMNSFGWRVRSEDEWEFEIDTPDQVLQLIELIAKWLNEERWISEGDSIWDFEDIREMLVQDIVNLAIIRAYMQSNPDIYLVFYDSY